VLIIDGNFLLFIIVILLFFAAPANGNFSDEVAYVKPQDTNSIEYTLQSDEVQMSKNRDRNRNLMPPSK
jgi:hypothetical protein